MWDEEKRSFDTLMSVGWWRWCWWLSLQALNFTISIHIAFYEDSSYFFLCWDESVYVLMWWTSFLLWNLLLFQPSGVDDDGGDRQSHRFLLEHSTPPCCWREVAWPSVLWIYVYVFQTGLKETRWSIGDNSNNLLLLNKLTNSLHYIYSTRCVFSMMW